jgi:translocator assembly and maintenance protein 41
MDQYLHAFKAPISFAFAYGSGIFSQYTKDSSASGSPLVDMILVTDNTGEFHNANYRQYPKHYPLAMRFLPFDTLGWINDNFGAGITFHPYASLPLNQEHLNPRGCKYGIMSKAALLRDLYEWETFYVSGRLQKPTLVLKPDQDILKAQLTNLKMTLALALLLLPEKFSLESLYTTIAQLSYTGDIRVGIAENPNKISMLVQAKCNDTYTANDTGPRLMSDYIRDMLLPVYNADTMPRILDESLFGKLYQPILSGNPGFFELSRLSEESDPRNIILCQPASCNLSKDYQSRLFQLLPKSIKSEIQDTGIDLFKDKNQLGAKLRERISLRVQKTSLAQSVKGIFTAGIYRSMKYGLAKLGKRIGKIY